MSLRVALLAPGQSYDCSGVSNPETMGESFMQICEKKTAHMTQTKQDTAEFCVFTHGHHAR